MMINANGWIITVQKCKKEKECKTVCLNKYQIYGLKVCVAILLI